MNIKEKIKLCNSCVSSTGVMSLKTIQDQVPGPIILNLNYYSSLYKVQDNNEKNLNTSAPKTLLWKQRRQR
jgi:hypothetical protein